MDIFVIGLIAATLRVATPLLFGTLGELFAERAGVLNLGIEGTLFFGSFIGFVVGGATGSLWLGVLAALVAGVLSGLLMGLLSVSLGLNRACFRIRHHDAVDGIVVVWFSPDLR